MSLYVCPPPYVRVQPCSWTRRSCSGRPCTTWPTPRKTSGPSRRRSPVLRSKLTLALLAVFTTLFICFFHWCGTYFASRHVTLGSCSAHSSLFLKIERILCLKACFYVFDCCSCSHNCKWFCGIHCIHDLLVTIIMHLQTLNERQTGICLVIAELVAPTTLPPCNNNLLKLAMPLTVCCA